MCDGLFNTIKHFLKLDCVVYIYFYFLYVLKNCAGVGARAVTRTPQKVRTVRSADRTPKSGVRLFPNYIGLCLQH